MSTTTVFDDILQGGGGNRTNSDGADHGITHTKQPTHTEQSDQTERTANAWIGDETEPADPPRVDHQIRRETRIVDRHTEFGSIPKVFVECGCGGCDDAVDPLADEDGPFDDVVNRGRWAIEECDDPRPVTVEKAGRVFYVYQMGRYRSEKGCRPFDVASAHREYFDAERQLMEMWNGDVTTALLSLRVRPVEQEGNLPDDVDGGDERAGDYYGITPTKPSGNTETGAATRYWVPPTKTDERLRDGWRNVISSLRYHLEGFEWEYAWVVAPTESAATPHLHVYLWVHDPDGALTVEHCRPAVEAFCRNTPNAYFEDHPIETGASDAVVISHDPTGYDAVEDDTVLKLYHDIGDDAFQMNTAGFAYMLNQRPEWAIKRIAKGTATIDEERTMLEGAATAWASPKRWIGGNIK